jgi:hypothetical protein
MKSTIKEFYTPVEISYSLIVASATDVEQVTLAQLQLVVGSIVTVVWTASICLFDPTTVTVTIYVAANDVLEYI